MDPVDSGRSAPPAVVPPRGLAGIFDDYDPTSILDTSQFPSNAVFLNVYDLGENDTFRQINSVSTANSRLLIGGVFHAGIEIYGSEWCYGATEEPRTGVSSLA